MIMRSRQVAITTTVLVLTVLFSACTEPNPAERRAIRAARANSQIVIGVGGPWATDQGAALWSGIELGIEEIHAAGGVLGRELAVVKKDDRNTVDRGKLIAQSFVDQPDMVAVLGHSDSFISLPNSIMYEYYGLLMISPLSTNPKLTRQGFSRVFRTIPDDIQFGTQIARFAASRGMERVMVYHARNAYGNGLANAFEKECESQGIVVPDRLAYDSGSDTGTFRRDVTFWIEHFVFDGVFVAGTVPHAALFVKVVRDMGVEVGILTGQGLDTPEFLEIAGDAAEGTFVGSVFIADDTRPETRAFVETYRRRWGTVPDAAAAQGYDTVRVLARAIEDAGCTVPDRISEALRDMTDFTGVTGMYLFDEKGDRSGCEILIKVVCDGRFERFEE